MKKKLMIGSIIISTLLIAVIILLNRNSIFNKEIKNTEKKDIILTEEQKGAEILSDGMSIDKDKLIYDGKTETGELIYSEKPDKDNSNVKNYYTVNVETGTYTINSEINISTGK
ncbi:MAG: hypothetical protein IKJ43_00865 [Bacilli bacterium]|nr:hypothetical protein [Bacilli bacterium]